MMLLAHHLVLHSLSGTHIDHGLVERRHAIGANDVVLTQGQTGRARRGRTQSAGVLQG